MAVTSIQRKKYMLATKSAVVNTQLVTDNLEIEKVNAYRFLGIWITTT